MQVTKKEASALNTLSKRSAAPILENALYTQEQGGTLMATNNAVALQVFNVGNDISESVLIPSKIEGGKVYEGDSKGLTCGNATIKPCLDLEEFPIMPEASNDCFNFGIFDLEEIRPRIEYILKAVATEPTRYAIQGVYIEYNDKCCLFVSTDGKRLHASGNITKTESKHKMIIAAQALQLVMKLTTAKSKGFLKIQRDIENDTTVLSLTSQTGKQQERKYTITGKMVEGHYPNFRDVIPKNLERSFTFTPDKEFLTLLKDSHKMATDEMKATTLSCDNESLLLDTTVREKGSVKGSIKIEGDKIEDKIGLDSRFFIEALVQDESFKFSHKDKNSPMLLTSGNFQAVIMPISLR